MSNTQSVSATASTQRAIVEAGDAFVIVRVETAASLERTFHALASRNVVDWWVRPGVFNTTEWTGDVRVGGHWRAGGLFRGEPYAVEGEFLEVDPPRRLAHRWRASGAPGAPTTVEYRLEKVGGTTRVTLRHSGFASREACANFGVGWQTSLDRLAEVLGSDRHPPEPRS